MSKELKPCPFCGGDEFEKIYDYSDIQGYTNACFSCTKCGAESSYYYTGSPEEKEAVIKHWNTRPAEKAKDKEIKRLKAALKRIAYYRDLNPEMKASKFSSCAEDGLRYLYCVMGDIAKTALSNAPDTGKMEKKEK